VAYFIVVACGATLYAHGITNITTAADAARALAPLAGKYAEILFVIGLANASLFAASVLPLSTAYTVCEALGFESGVGKSISDAPVFYALYLSLIVLGALPVLIPNAPLFTIIFYSQVVSGMLLPVIVIAMLRLVNDRHLMGKYVNGPIFNVVAWATAGVAIVATIVSIGAALLHVGAT
jgi:Mn2+/Fe2+ NRAMP family transporter